MVFGGRLWNKFACLQSMMSLNMFCARQRMGTPPNPKEGVPPTRMRIRMHGPRRNKGPQGATPRTRPAGSHIGINGVVPCGTTNHETPSWTAGLNWMDNPRSRGLKFLPPPNLQAGGGSPRVTPRGLSELCLRQALPSTSGYLYPAARTRRCPRHQRGDPAPLVEAAAP